MRWAQDVIPSFLHKHPQVALVSIYVSSSNSWGVDLQYTYQEIGSNFQQSLLSCNLNFLICCLPKNIPLGFYPMDLSVVRSQTALWHFKERSSTNREIKVFLLCVNSNYYHGQNFRKNSSKRTKAVCKTKCYTFHQCLRWLIVLVIVALNYRDTWC